MKAKKGNTTSQKLVLKKKIQSKRKISTPKAGASLVKAVKNVQQILKKKIANTTKSNLTNVKLTRLDKKKLLKNGRGIVYVGHIPHGFYEEQMEDYFKQFGKVTRVRIARSKNTGKSRGYGYVEFLHASVAKIAAETMNNYLMCGRLLKATYIPPEKQHLGFFSGKNWSEEEYPKLKNRRKVTARRNKTQSMENHDTFVQRSLHKLSVLETKLQDKGISIKFKPVSELKAQHNVK